LDLFVRAADSETSFFTITAIADPGVIPRVLELFAKRGWVPSFLQSRQVGPKGEALTIDIRMPGLATATAEYIAACLRQIGLVTSVIMEREPLES
jgi:hypothetical protein